MRGEDLVYTHSGRYVSWHPYPSIGIITIVLHSEEVLLELITLVARNPIKLVVYLYHQSLVVSKKD